MSETQVNVLVIEDNPADTLIVQELLAEDRTGQRYDIVPTERLRDALGLVQHHAFDVVLLDLGLPDSQGMDSLIRLKRAAAAVPVIVLTHLDDEEVALQAAQHGAQDYLVKGQFAGTDLVRSIRYALERRRSDEAMRVSEAQLRTLAESLPNLVWTCRADGWCDYLSPQWVEYTGYPEDRQLGAGWSEQLHPDDRESVRKAWAIAVERGTAYDVEFRIRRHDGVYRWFKTRAIPLLDGAGKIVKWFGSNTDVENYKQAERELLTQLERLALLDRTTRAIARRMDSTSIQQIVVGSLEDSLAIDFACLCLCDSSRRTMTVACVGTRSSELAGRLEMSASTQLAIDQMGFSRFIQGSQVYEANLATIDLPFSKRCVRAGLGSLVVSPLTVDETVTGVLIAARRATEGFTIGDCEFLRQLSEHVALATKHAGLYASLERAYEDLRTTQESMLQHERLRALGQMASGIAHDINNALSPAGLYTESLRARESNLSTTAREQLVVIQRAIEDVTHTVARMREFFRPQDAQLKLVAVDVHRTMEQVVQLTRARWLDMPQEKGIVIRLERDFAAAVPEILGAESEIRDALTNLIFNAVDAMPSGGTLTLRSRVVERMGGRSSAPIHPIAVYIEVCDTGVGMSIEAKARCLEPFFTTKGERGTGLGLAMVYGMVQRHHADIEIDSAPGKGTTVRLIFSALAEKNRSDQIASGSTKVRHLSILLIDDDSKILEACRIVLEADGHTIAIAAGGKAGIEAFRQAQQSNTPFDIVMTDLGMPHVDGSQVATAIKALAPATPIILLTGWGHRLPAGQAIPEHVDRVLSKPPKLPELRATLAELASAPASIGRG